MNIKTLVRPLRVLSNHKIIFSVLLLSIFVFSVPLYIKHSIEKYTKLHELEVDIDSIHFNWRFWKFPSMIMKKINIKNKGLNPTFTHISAKSIVLEANYIEFLKSYMKDYKFSLEIKALKVLLINGSMLEAETLSSNLHYTNNSYKIHNFNVHPFKIKLDNGHSSCIKGDKEKTCDGRLILYVIRGEGEYHALERELEIYLKAPPASTQQMPDGTAYTVQAKGKIKFLGLMPYQYTKNPDDPSVRGVVTYTIDNFSNMLHQLNQAKFISKIAENLGTIIGYPIPRVDPFTEQAEIFTNAVSLDMTFKTDGIYLGAMKL